MSPSFLKPDCPCGDDRCSATGEPIKRTGHSKHCWDGCPVCAKGGSTQGSSRKIPTLLRRQVRARSGGRCEVVCEDGERCQFPAEHLHHRRMRSQGGHDTFANLLDVCFSHHDLIHANPAWSMERGYLIGASSGPEPESSAVTNVSRVERHG